MEVFGGLVRSIAFLILGLAFFGLAAWEWAVGLSAGSFGGASFSDSPGIAWFILAIQIAWGILFLVAAEELFRGSFARSGTDGIQHNRPTYLRSAATLLIAGFGGVTVLLGIWAVFEMVSGAIGVLRDAGDDIVSTAVTGFFLFSSIAVFVTLLFTLLVRPFYTSIAPRLQLALDHLLNRT